MLVVGVEGGRPDHALGNLLLLASDRFEAVEIEVVLARGRLWVVRDELTGRFPAGAIVSLLPIHGDAVATVAGVRWPLDRHVLPAGTTHGISNEADGAPFSLTVHRGTVLCISPRTDEVHP